MDIKLPNGTLLKGVPDGTSKEDIAKKAISAGLAKPEDFGELNASKSPQTENKAEPAKLDINELEEIGGAPELNALSVPAFKASLGLLTTGDTKSLKGILKSQFGDDVSFEDSGDTAIVKLPSGSYALNSPGFSFQDAARFTAQALSFTPAGRAATIPKAAAASGATEAGMATVENELGGQNVDPGRIATAAALGGTFKGLEDAIGAGYRAYKGRAGGSGGELIEDAKDLNVPLMTTDVIEPKTFAGKAGQQTAEKIPFAGTGGLREAQQVRREDAISEVAEKYGQFSYGSIVKSLNDQKNRVKSAAGNVLNQAGQKLDDVGEIPITNTQQAIREINAELSKRGVIKSGSALEDLQVLTEALEEAPQSFTTLKENRTAFRDIVKSTDKADRSQLTSKAKSLLTKAQTAMTRDMEDFAKKNLSGREFSQWKKANNIYAEEAIKLSKSRLKNVLDKGDVTPESVQNVLFSKKPSEVKQLYSSLTQEGRKNARSAIVSKVVNDLKGRASGFTPNSFASELKKYDDQINVFFKGSEKRQLEGLRKVLDATRRAQDAAVTTATGQQVLGAGGAYAAFTDLGATLLSGGTIGSLARLYESAPVRNALLKIASVPKGSTEFEKALLDLQSIVNANAQAATPE